MKKYWWIGVLVAVACFAAYYFAQTSEPKEYAVGSAEWKYYTVENETKVRPASYDSLKWQEGDAVELRAPASKKKSRN